MAFKRVIIRRVGSSSWLSGPMTFFLMQCDATGNTVMPVQAMPESITNNCVASAELYKRIGFDEPWVSYVAINENIAVGGGAFVGAPRDGVVEIAYFTLPEYEGRGFAYSTATQLCQIARTALPHVILSAYTLPELNASNRILSKLGFVQFGTAHDEDAGEVWEWRT